MSHLRVHKLFKYAHFATRMIFSELQCACVAAKQRILFSGARLFGWKVFTQLYWFWRVSWGWREHVTTKTQDSYHSACIFAQKAYTILCISLSWKDGHVANSASIYLLSPRLQSAQSTVLFIFLWRYIQRVKSQKTNPAAAQGKIKEPIWKFSSKCFGTNKNFLTKIKTCVGNVNLCLIFPFLLQHKNSVTFLAS